MPAARRAGNRSTEGTASDSTNAAFVQRRKRRERLLGTLLTLPSPEVAGVTAFRRGLRRGYFEAKASKNAWIFCVFGVTLGSFSMST